jgi:hypothetical protein
MASRELFRKKIALSLNSEGAGEHDCFVAVLEKQHIDEAAVNDGD